MRCKPKSSGFDCSRGDESRHIVLEQVVFLFTLSVLEEADGQKACIELLTN